MTRTRMSHAAATSAAVLMLLLGAMSCSSNTVRGAGAEPPYSQNEAGENAIEIDFPPPSANGHDPATNGHEPPPPAFERDGFPPSRQGGVARSNPRRSEIRAPATDTMGDEASDLVAEGPPAAGNRPFQGFGAFTKPGDMEIENWSTLEFHAGQTRAALREASEDRELTTARGITMAPTMRVSLLPDPNFDVKPQSPAIQEIQETGSGLAGSWQWKVKPLKGGDFTLFARVEVLERGADGQLLKGPDGEIKGHAYPAKRVDVHVRVGTWRGFLNALQNAASLGDLLGTLFRSWEKSLAALTALVVALGALWAAIRKLRNLPARG